jgi:hypothetical protein
MITIRNEYPLPPIDECLERRQTLSETVSSMPKVIEENVTLRNHVTERDQRIEEQAKND